MTTQKPSTSISMPSAADKSPPKPNNTSPPSKGSEDPVDSFFSFVGEYCAGDEFKRLKGMCQENTGLKKNINELQTAYEQNIKALTRSDNKWQSEHNKLKEVDSARDDAVKQLKDERQASQALKDRVRNMEEHVKTVTATSKSWESRAVELGNKEKAKATHLENAQKEKERLEEELKSTQKQLKSKTSELGQVQDKFKLIRSFVVELESLVEKETEVRSLLANFFDLALKHMETFLCSNLDNACFADHSHWKELRVQVSSKQRVPLPASNSPAAKQMRIVAGLIIFGEALAEYIFRPTHITHDGELDEVLGHLGTQNPLQEMYTRSALLKMLPDRQEKNQEAAVKSVVTHVSGVLSILVPSSRRGEFESGLKHVSGQICRGWSKVQQLEERVRPSFSLDFSEDWQPLRPPNAQTSTKSSSSSSAQSSTQQKGRRQNQQQSTTPPGLLVTEEFKEVAWPAFLAINPEQLREEEEDDDANSSWALIHHGYVLTKAQAKEAEQERDAEEEVSRRVRKTTRQNGSDARRPQGRRRDSGIGRRYGTP
ncbi:hypothetical protein CEP54_016236 [Fusarium duplospermum]|uniref:MEI5 protein n=1 Tax=Fusarium duplospermum TaxID=1325734 RepID=A0A428NGJ2_9HYPO|nr:hypothetical protein CEP54_016236 [Fusarium duplospermum]